MRGIVWATAMIFACAAAGWSQAYYEASGQTAVFTLTAGATAIRGGSVAHAGINSGVSITTTRGGMLVVLPALRGSADIALYDIAGRQLYRQRGYSGTSLRLETRAYTPGIYTAFVRVNGKSYTRRFAVTGQGE